MITIDKNFSIETDGNGCTLVKNETKNRIGKETKQPEDYETSESWHYLNVEQCLRKYLDLVQEPCKNVLEVLKAINDCRLTISSLKVK